MASKDQSHGYPVQIVDVINGKPVLREKELEKILLPPGLEDMPVKVLSIGGMFRAGKSFLLNLLIRYLSQDCSQNWMDDQDSKQRGFEWRSGSNRVTTGIWMWSNMFVLQTDDSKFGLVLMDTQGTHDPYSSTAENASIFTLSAILSSIKIYNVIGCISESDLNFLELIVRNGIAVKGDENNVFQTLLFLVRDWQYPMEFNFGIDGGMTYLKNRMVPSSKQSQENQASRKLILGWFDNIKCFLMPHPGKMISYGISSGHLKDIDAEFQVQMKDLVKILCSSEVKRIDGKDVTCEGFVNYFKVCLTIIRTGNPFEFLSTAEVYAIANERRSYIDVLRNFEKDMNKLCENYQENLHKIGTERKKQALDDFKNRCGLSLSKEYEALEATMKEAIDNKMQIYCNKNDLTEANARMYNYKILNVAVKRFTAGINEICLEASECKSEFEEKQRHALAYFREHGKEGGPSYSMYIRQLEAYITNFCDNKEKTHFLNKKRVLRGKHRTDTTTLQCMSGDLKAKQVGDHASSSHKQLIPELSLEDFRQLLIDVSAWWKRRGNVNMLKVLLSDFNAISLIQIEEKNEPSDLFGLLWRSRCISPSNIDVLIEAAVLGRLDGVQRKIKETVPTFPGLGKIVIRRFSTHRQNLIKFGRIVSKDKKERIVNLYALTRDQIVDSWVMIFELEKKCILTEERKESFIQKLEDNGMKREARTLKKT